MCKVVAHITVSRTKNSSGQTASHLTFCSVPEQGIEALHCRSPSEDECLKCQFDWSSQFLFIRLFEGDPDYELNPTNHSSSPSACVGRPFCPGAVSNGCCWCVLIWVLFFNYFFSPLTKAFDVETSCQIFCMLNGYEGIGLMFSILVW